MGVQRRRLGRRTSLPGRASSKWRKCVSVSTVQGRFPTAPVAAILLPCLLTGAFADAASVIAAADDGPNSSYKPPWFRQEQHVPAASFSASIDPGSGQLHAHENEPGIPTEEVVHARSGGTRKTILPRNVSSKSKDAIKDALEFGMFDDDANEVGVRKVKFKRHHLLTNEAKREQVELNPCLGEPCKHGVCKNSPNRTTGYECFCEDGYTGYECQTDWNECWNDPCLNGATCFDAVAYPNCSCATGFTGKFCERRISECDSSPCLNNATCVDNYSGNFSCICLPGYEGYRCEIDASFCNESRANNVTLCKNNGLCVDMEGEDFFCLCADGWTGQFCEENINECHSHPCMHGGLCHDLINGFSCACPEMLTGDVCQYNMTECQNRTCQNGGICLFDPKEGQEACYCPPDFHGPDCSERYDECSLGHKCINGGVCLDAVDGYHCLCPPSSTGFFCECQIGVDDDCLLLGETTIRPDANASSTTSSSLTTESEIATSPGASTVAETTSSVGGESVATEIVFEETTGVQLETTQETEETPPVITDKSGLDGDYSDATTTMSDSSATASVEVDEIPTETTVDRSTAPSTPEASTAGTVPVPTTVQSTETEEEVSSSEETFGTTEGVQESSSVLSTSGTTLKGLVTAVGTTGVTQSDLTTEEGAGTTSYFETSISSSVSSSQPSPTTEFGSAETTGETEGATGSTSPTSAAEAGEIPTAEVSVSTEAKATETSTSTTKAEPATFTEAPTTGQTDSTSTLGLELTRGDVTTATVVLSSTTESLVYEISTSVETTMTPATKTTTLRLESSTTTDFGTTLESSASSGTTTAFEDADTTTEESLSTLDGESQGKNESTAEITRRETTVTEAAEAEKSETTERLITTLGVTDPGEARTPSASAETSLSTTSTAGVMTTMTPAVRPSTELEATTVAGTEDSSPTTDLQTSVELGTTSVRRTTSAYVNTTITAEFAETSKRFTSSTSPFLTATPSFPTEITLEQTTTSSHEAKLTTTAMGFPIVTDVTTVPDKKTTEYAPGKTTTELWNGCLEDVCLHGGTCVVNETSVEPFRCECPLNFMGSRCQHEINATVPSFGPQSFLIFDVDDATSSVVEVFLGVHVKASEGRILQARDPEPFLNISLRNGKISLEFSCGSSSTGTLNDGRNVVSTYVEIWIRLDLDYAGDRNSRLCKASLRVNETEPASSIEHRSKSATHRLKSIVIGRGFVGCISTLQVNSREIILSSDATDGAGVSECGQEEMPDFSMGCPYNPCFNGGTCVRFSSMAWKCFCTPGFEGDLCERQTCLVNNPCSKNSSCLASGDVSPFEHKFCVCHHGFTGPTCDIEMRPVTEPFFYGTLNGYSSYLAYLTPANLERRLQLRFHFATDNLEQRAILFYVGQQFPRRATPHFDFLAVGIRNGYLVILWNLGLGTSEVISPSPLDPSLVLHTLKLTRIGNVAWIQIDTQPVVGGISPPFLADLNVHSLLYVGGHWSYNHSMLPEIIRSYSGFRGCILDLQIRPADQGIFLGPVRTLGGRNVGQCSRDAQEDKPCPYCLNGGTCNFYGSSVKCICSAGYTGLKCEKRTDEPDH